jgi:DNA modification methylase
MAMAKATGATSTASINGRTRRPTATSNFGVSKRENHDSSAFYRRFVAPTTTDDDTVLPPFEIDDPFRHHDARHMSDLPDGSVALVVTSPPYFAGKQYEEELDREGVPSSYIEYLDLLEAVFRECAAKLEPGGRIAVNVANLGRRPYRSLSADVVRILQDELGLLLRGEVVWQKGEGATGSCAWGSFRSASSPTLRDLTERVIIASKGRFDRARPVRQREAEGLPHRNTVTADEFMAATLDVWQIPPESAKRVDHPAPFPVELPERLILLNTFEGDLVLDPFMGSGSTLVAAARHGRRYVGYDLDPAYCAIAERRVAAELASPVRDESEQRAVAQGKSIQTMAEGVLADAGFRFVARKRRLRGLGVDVSLVMADAGGHPWMFDVSGAFTTTRSGLRRADTLLRTLGKANVIANGRDRLGGDLAAAPLVLLTSHLPPPGSDGDLALRAAGPAAFFDAVEMLDDGEGFARLRAYASGASGQRDAALPGFWR